MSRDAIVHAVASLAAAISLLEHTPKAKKAAASDRMFDQMLTDYRGALDNARAALADDAGPIRLKHLAVADEYGLRWLTGRRMPAGVESVELYAMPDYGRAPEAVYSAPPAQPAASAEPVLCVSSADFKRLREGDAYIKAWLPPANKALDMPLYAAPVAAQAPQVCKSQQRSGVWLAETALEQEYQRGYRKGRKDAAQAPQDERQREIALEDAARQCEDIYTWRGAYSAGTMHTGTLNACAEAIRALKSGAQAPAAAGDARDAARYRWLRDDPRADVRIIGVGKRSGEQLDIAVAAMSAGRERGS